MLADTPLGNSHRPGRAFNANSAVFKICPLILREFQLPTEADGSGTQTEVAVLNPGGGGPRIEARARGTTCKPYGARHEWRRCMPTARRTDMNVFINSFSSLISGTTLCQGDE
jgi:hypothetical protein